MRNEIGSEYWHDATDVNGMGVYSYLPANFHIRYVLSGRTALDIIIADIKATRNIKTVYMPSYCCESMLKPLKKQGVGVIFYDVVFQNGQLCYRFNDEHDADVVFLLDYFGFKGKSTEKIALEQKRRGKIIIYDATHAVFCEKVNYQLYDYVFASFRKWFEACVGFCAAKNEWKQDIKLVENQTFYKLRELGYEIKKRYMCGLQEDKSIFLNINKEFDERLDEDYMLYSPDNKSLNLLANVNVEWLRKKRRENVEFLLEYLSDYKAYFIIKELRQDDCPLFFPIVIKQNRNYIRQELIKNNIYLPVHWELSELQTVSDEAKEIYNQELSVVCDQRYNVKDMQNIADCIINLLKGGL